MANSLKKNPLYTSPIVAECIHIASPIQLLVIHITVILRDPLGSWNVGRQETEGKGK